MTGVRLLVGTRKGAFTLTADGTRKNWEVNGPHFGGWEIYHVNGSAADPDRLWASQTSAWFGQVIQRSDNGGRTWQPVGNDFTYAGDVGEHLWYDGTPRPWEFKRIWHIEPSRTDPDVVYAGAEDAALYRSADAGATWTELTALSTHESGPRWQPGAGGMCLHTIILDPVNKDRIFVAISAAGAFRSDDGGGHWREISGDLPTDFGFPIAVHAHEPETVYVVPIKSDSEHYVPDARLRVYRSRTGGGEWEPLTNGLPQENCYVNILRDAMAVDTLDDCGIYFGTTGGQIYGSPDGGDSWQPIVRDLPAVLSVEVQVLP